MTASADAPAVSVIIPLYNKGPYIVRALESVLAQSEQNFEIVVINDASTDGGEAIVKDYSDRRIRLIHRDTPGPGGHAARNAGIEAAAAPLMAFLDADDSWEPLFLETILRMRAAFPQAGAFATAYRTIYRDGTVELRRYHGIPEAPWEGIVPDYFESVIKAPVLAVSIIAIPREVFAAVGRFPEGVPRGGDIEMWFRIAIKYPVAFSRYVGGTWFRDSGNSICDTVELPADPLILSVIRRAIGDPSVGPALAEKLRAQHDALIDKFAKQCLLAGRPNAARHLLDGALAKRSRGYYLLSFIPGRVLVAVIEARRRLLGLPP